MSRSMGGHHLAVGRLAVAVRNKQEKCGGIISEAREHSHIERPSVLAVPKTAGPAQVGEIDGRHTTSIPQHPMPGTSGSPLDQGCSAVVWE